MRVTILCAALLLFVSPLFADNIYFRDGSSVSGKVLRVTDTEIEFSTSDIPFDKRSRSALLKIVYTNGKTVMFNESADKSKPQQYGIFPVDASNNVQSVPSDNAQPYRPLKPSRIGINFFGGLGGTWSKMENTEHDTYNIVTTDSYGQTCNNRPYAIIFHLGVFADVSPIYSEVSNDLFVMCGLRGMYSYSNIEQDIDDSSSVSSESASGTLGSGTYMKYHSLGIGPVLSLMWLNTQELRGHPIRWYLSPKIFAVAGPIFSGKLSPGVAASDAGVIPKLPTTTFDGVRLSAGTGLELGIGNFDCGCNLYYSRNWITLKDKVYDNVGRSTTFNEVTIDFYLGVNM
jgi:hypothetical protein